MGLSALLVGLKLGAFGILRFAFTAGPDGGARILLADGGTGRVRRALWGAGGAAAVQSSQDAGLFQRQPCRTGDRGHRRHEQPRHTGAIFQLLNFGVVAGGLMLLVGFLHHRLGSTDLASLGGLVGRCRCSPLFPAVGMASIGLPGTNGFVAELLILLGDYAGIPGLALVALGA